MSYIKKITHSDWLDQFWSYTAVLTERTMSLAEFE